MHKEYATFTGRAEFNRGALKKFVADLLMAEFKRRTAPGPAEPRAPRLPLRAPIRFLSADDLRDAEAWTVNISRSGVLFKIDQTVAELPVDVEYVIQLSKGALQGPGVPLLPNLHCSGQVVRHTDAPDGTRLYAVTITSQQVDDPT